MSPDAIEQMIGKLHEAMNILCKEVPLADPDMDVTEWNASPIGRAVNLIDDVMVMLDESGGE